MPLDERKMYWDPCCHNLRTLHFHSSCRVDRSDKSRSISGGSHITTALGSFPSPVEFADSVRSHSSQMNRIGPSACSKNIWSNWLHKPLRWLWEETDDSSSK